MILIVDDFRDGAEALCRLLTLRGYRCGFATEPTRALAMILAHPRDEPLLVILDEDMPELTGTEILRRLRAAPPAERRAVIMYSAVSDVAQREEALQLGAVAWLLKGGIEVQSVLGTIGEWYGRIATGPINRRDGSLTTSEGVQ